ncbi:hypothetical protein ACFONG_13135 [Uliginosibacterium paludis]|uniref:Uncharacterized protein n=1 Tax=Uliginosibacterium paludis TaxID=1615952 RepID=A0ABV2CPX4_9RHOO
MKARGKLLLTVIAFVFYSGVSRGGSADGPFVIWLDTTQSSESTKVIKENFNIKKDKCGQPSAIVFLKSHPKWVSQEFVKHAIFYNEKKSISKLNKYLKTPFLDADLGFDGIMVYRENPDPIIYYFRSGENTVRTIKSAKPSDRENFWAAFCIALPESTQSP